MPVLYYVFLLTLSIVTKKNTNSVVFADPPIIDDLKVEKNIQWNDDDWANITQGEVCHGCPMDKRWEDLKIVKSNLITLGQIPKAFSIFISTLYDIQLFLTNTYGNISKKYNIQKFNTSRWIHFTVDTENNHTILSEGNKEPTKYKDFSPHEIVIKDLKNHSNNFFLKMHNYTYRWANKTSRIPTSIKFPPSNKTCLKIYTSLEENCYLEVIVKSKDQIISEKIISPHNSDDVNRKMWQEETIDIKPGKENKLLIYRIHSQNETYGHWAFVTRECADDIEIYRFEAESQSLHHHTCRFLNENQFNNNKPFSCKVGFIGQHCNITCGSVLGQNYSHCQQHKICEDSSCECAWGYGGPLCEEPCKNNTCGLSCKKNCNPKCEKCDVQTCQCHSVMNSSFSLESSPVVFFVLLTLLIIRY